MVDLLTETKQFRSYSDTKIDHHRSNSSQSVDLFSLVIPPNDGSSLSSLICPICSLPMMKPTLLPCQHTFCFKCIQNNHQMQSGSLPIHSSNCFLSSDHSTKTITCQKCSRTHLIKSLSDLEENRSIELLINTLLCETCHQLYPSNQLDTCFHCFGVLCPKCFEEHLRNEKIDSEQHQVLPTTVQSKSVDKDRQIFKTKSFNTEKKSSNGSTKQLLEMENAENIEPSHPNNTKKRSNSLFRKIIHPSRHRQSTSPSRKDSLPKSPSTPAKLSHRPKISIDIDVQHNQPSHSETVPVTPVRQFLNLFDQYSHTSKHIQQYKQRQSELDRAVNKLIEVLTIKTNDTINQMSQYWIYFKQIILDEYQPKSNRFQLLDYLINTCCSTIDSRKQFELHFQHNDEIKATLQVLITTLIIVRDEQTFLTLNQLFDREEQSTIRTLSRHLEIQLSSYADELSFIRERVNVYQARFTAWKNSNTTELDSITSEWKQSIEHDYPSLIERISNDYVTKIPQMEKLLLQMLRNMKKRLLDADGQPASRRTSVS